MLVMLNRYYYKSLCYELTMFSTLSLLLLVLALFSGSARSYRHSSEISIHCLEPDRYGGKAAKAYKQNNISSSEL